VTPATSKRASLHPPHLALHLLQPTTPYHKSRSNTIPTDLDLPQPHRPNPLPHPPLLLVCNRPAANFSEAFKCRGVKEKAFRGKK